MTSRNQIEDEDKYEQGTFYMSRSVSALKTECSSALFSLSIY